MKKAMWKADKGGEYRFSDPRNVLKQGVGRCQQRLEMRNAFQPPG